MQSCRLKVSNRIIYALKCSLLRLPCLEVTFNCLFHEVVRATLPRDRKRLQTVTV